MKKKVFKVYVLFFLVLGTLLLSGFYPKESILAQTCSGSGQYVDYSCNFDDITLTYGCISNGGMTVACAGVPCQSFGPVFCFGGTSCTISSYGSTVGCNTTPPPPAVCGNGTRETGEGCDDGNTTNGDGCSSSCQVETSNPVCGNGKLETGEECDDGNTTNGDGCSSSCVRDQDQPVCPNGIVEAGEACDDGNSNNLDGCRNNCTTPYCGDGIIDPPGETCDGGVGCTSNCTGNPGGGYDCNGSSCEASVGGPYTASDCGGACNTTTGQFFCGNDLACHPCGAGDSNCKSLGDCQNECKCTSPGGCFTSGCNPLATSGICDGALIPGANTTGCMGNGWMELLDLSSKRVRYHLDCGSANWGHTNIGGGGRNYEGLGVLRKVPNPPDPNYPWVEVALLPNGQGGSIDFTDPYLTSGFNNYKIIARCAYRENTGTADRIHWTKIGGITYHNDIDFYDVSMYSACSQNKVLQLVLTPPVCNNWFISPNIDSNPKVINIESNAYDAEGLAGGGMYYITLQNGSYGSIDTAGNFVAGTAGEIIANTSNYFTSGTTAGKITATFETQNLPSGNYQFQGNYWNKYASFPSTDPLHFQQCVSPTVYIDNTPPTCGNWSFSPASPLDSITNSFSVSTTATDDSAIRDFGFYYQNYDESTDTWGHYDAGGVFIPNSYVPIVSNTSDYFSPTVKSPTITNFINRSNIPSNKFRFFANYWDSSAPHNLSAGSNNFAQCVSPVYEIKSSSPVISLTIPPASAWKGYSDYYSDGVYSVLVNITDTAGDVNNYKWLTTGGALIGSLRSGLISGQVFNYPFSLSLDWTPGSAFNQVGTSKISFNSVDLQGNDITVSDQISTVSPAIATNTTFKYRNKVVTNTTDTAYLSSLCDDGEFNDSSVSKDFNNGNDGRSADLLFTSQGTLAYSGYNKTFSKKCDASKTNCSHYSGSSVSTNLVEMSGSSYYNVSFIPQFTDPSYKVLCARVRDTKTGAVIKRWTNSSDILLEDINRESSTEIRAVFGKVPPKGWLQAVGGNIFTGTDVDYDLPYDTSVVDSQFVNNIFNLSNTTVTSGGSPITTNTYSGVNDGFVVSNGNIRSSSGSVGAIGIAKSGSFVQNCGDCASGLADYITYLQNNLTTQSLYVIPFFSTNFWWVYYSGGAFSTNLTEITGSNRLFVGGNTGTIFVLFSGDLVIRDDLIQVFNDARSSVIMVVPGNVTIEKDVQRVEATLLVGGTTTIEGAQINEPDFEKDLPLIMRGSIYSVGGINANRSTAQKDETEAPLNGHDYNGRPVETFIFQPQMFLGDSPAESGSSNIYLRDLN